MRRQGSGFGFVMLIVVLAVVLFLATRAFKSTLPAAKALSKPEPVSADSGGGSPSQGGGESIRPSRLPDLKEAKRGTDAHAAQVKEAIEKTQE